MKILDKITLRKMLAHRENCRYCGGKGYILHLDVLLDAKKFRVVYPCHVCIKQVVRIEED